MDISKEEVTTIKTTIVLDDYEANYLAIFLETFTASEILKQSHRMDEAGVKVIREFMYRLAD